MNEMTYRDIVAIRQKLGMSIPGFCALVGISPATYYSYRNQRRPRGPLVILLRCIRDNPETMYAMIRETKSE